MSTTVIQTEEGFEVREDNHLIGYVDNNMLYVIDTNGFSRPVEKINHRSEIIGKLREWQIQNAPKRFL